MRILESGENYLETILILKNRNGSVRSIDVANELCFTKPSVSRAIGILKKAGLLEIGEGGLLLLTEEGESRASEVYERHRLISRFLVEILQVSKETADADACKIEHFLSEETFQKIKDKLK